MTLDERIKAALKADFNKLYVKEFTTDWKTQRVLRGLEIDVMGHDAIKQAFKDAGYVRSYKTDSAGRVTIPVTEHPIVVDTALIVMTGKEWYERFEKELDKYVTENYMDAIYPHEALKAAQKAADLVEQ